MKPRSLVLNIVVVALALASSSLCAQDGYEGALARGNLTTRLNLGAPFNRTLAAADFDGDNKPDGALLLDRDWRGPGSRFRTIELHFTGRGNTVLTFESSEPTLAISASDVNGDGAADIVVEQRFTHKRLQVWLNDGRGGFRRVRNDDFPFAGDGSYEGLGSPSQRADIPTVCLPPERGPETAILAAGPSSYGSTSSLSYALPFTATLGLRNAASNSSRAPPLFQPL